jgi:nucleoside-diphosphate-sugar epimerase
LAACNSWDDVAVLHRRATHDLDSRQIVLPDGGSAPSQWVFVEDVATACVRALEVPGAVGQAFNIGHVEPLTQRSFVEALARVAGMEPRFVSVPRATIRAAGGQLIGDATYFGDYLDLPPRTSVAEKAARVLGVTPTPFEAALGQGFAWYQAQPRRPIDYMFEDRLIAEA